ncbi:hypothetical protein [Sinomonas soli]
MVTGTVPAGSRTAEVDVVVQTDAVGYHQVDPTAELLGEDSSQVPGRVGV